MSILNLRPAREEKQAAIPPAPAIPYAPKPKPSPHQLGNATLANVEAITDMSAEEIEKTADSLESAAHVEAEGLREVARRIRATGRLANEHLANVVHVLSTCADAGKHMQAAVAERNEPQPAPADKTKLPDNPLPVNLDAISEKIAAATDEARGDA
jgi:hypothetical protein